VIYEYTREEEFIAARSRHPMRIKMKTGVKKDGRSLPTKMYALSDTGAYGCHALTVTGNTGHKAMALYVGDGEYRKSPNIRSMPMWFIPTRLLLARSADMVCRKAIGLSSVTWKRSHVH